MNSDVPVKSAEEIAKQEFEEGLIAEFENKPAPDIQTFKVKDKGEVMFGLTIEARHEASFNMSVL